MERSITLFFPLLLEQWRASFLCVCCKLPKGQMNSFQISQKQKGGQRMKLVIAEKPSVAQSLAAVLGAKEKKTGIWKETAGWCLGVLGIW